MSMFAKPAKLDQSLLERFINSLKPENFLIERSGSSRFIAQHEELIDDKKFKAAVIFVVATEDAAFATLTIGELYANGYFNTNAHNVYYNEADIKPALLKDLIEQLKPLVIQKAKSEGI
jgi:hypothetical protein